MFAKLLMSVTTLFMLGILANPDSMTYAATFPKEKKQSEKMHIKFEKRLHELELEITKLELKITDKIADMNSTIHKQYRDEIEQYKQTEQGLKEKLSMLKNKTGEEWKKMKIELSTAMDELRQKIKESSKSIRKMY